MYFRFFWLIRLLLSRALPVKGSPSIVRWYRLAPGWPVHPLHNAKLAIVSEELVTICAWIRIAWLGVLVVSVWDANLLSCVFCGFQFRILAQHPIQSGITTEWRLEKATITGFVSRALERHLWVSILWFCFAWSVQLEFRCSMWPRTKPESTIAGFPCTLTSIVRLTYRWKVGFHSFLDKLRLKKLISVENFDDFMSPLRLHKYNV